jgi:hypothetical protein
MITRPLRRPKPPQEVRVRSLRRTALRVNRPFHTVGVCRTLQTGRRRVVFKVCCSLGSVFPGRAQLARFVHKAFVSRAADAALDTRHASAIQRGGVRGAREAFE